MIKSTDALEDFPKEFNSLEARYDEIKERVAKHERWIKQIAEKIGITLEE